LIDDPGASAARVELGNTTNKVKRTKALNNAPGLQVNAGVLDFPILFIIEVQSIFPF
jgi:hypothetical protein